MAELLLRFSKKMKAYASKSNTRKVYSLVVFSLLFICGLDLFTLSGEILAILCVIVAIKILLCEEIIINATLILIALFGASYAGFYILQFGFEYKLIMQWVIAPIILYEIGISLLKTCKNNGKTFLDVLFVFSLGFSIYVFSCIIYRLFQFGMFSTARILIDVWSDNYIISTGIGTMMASSSALVFPSLFIRSPDKKRYHFFGGIFFFLVSIISALSLSNRAQLMALVLGIFIGLLFVLTEHKRARKNLMYILSAILFVAVIAIVMNQANIIDIEKFISKIPLLNRLSGDENMFQTERVDTYISFFNQFLMFPFGGKQIILPSGVGYCHNVWMDFYYYVGIVPVLFFAILSVSVLKKIIVVCVLEKSFLTKTTIICYSSIMLLTFMIEPVQYSALYFFLMIFVFIGMLDYYYYMCVNAYVSKNHKSLPVNGKFKIAFVSCYLTVHQHALCKELIKKYKDRFRFIELKDTNNHIGFKKTRQRFKKYVVSMSQQERKAHDCINEADVLICGNVPSKIIYSQLKKEKIVFKYSERLYKTKNPFAYLHPKAIYQQFRDYHRMKKYKFYYLCASAYTSLDVSRFAVSEKRCYKWGYFTKESRFKSFKELLEIKNQEDITEILFVNRLIDWKHPEKCLTVAKHLKAKKVPFRMNIVGSGYMLKRLKYRIKKYGLQEHVFLLGAIDNRKVLKMMEAANIVFASSDYREGWGACINEAMTAGCAVVASHSHGSVPYLIDNQINGIIYNFGDDDDMVHQVEQLCKNRFKVIEIGENAFNTMKTTWSARNATIQFLKIAKEMMMNRPVSYCEKGPMSLARIFDHEWLEKKCNK